MPDRFAVHETFIADDRADVAAAVDEFFGDAYEVVNPFFPRPDIGGHAWFLWAEHGERRYLLDGVCDNNSFPGAQAGGFHEWLADFRPRNANDWLVAPRLYSHFVQFGAPNWACVQALSSRYVDQVLAPTRGLLLWTTQMRHLMYLAERGLSSEQAGELVRGYQRLNPEAHEILQAMQIDGLSILEVFEHRTQHQACFFGTPDYYVSGLLSQHMAA